MDQLSYKDAQIFVKTLNLKTEDEYHNWHKETNCQFMPYHPRRGYKSQGCTSIGDFLGTNSIAVQKRIFCTYEEAVKCARENFILTQIDWGNFVFTHKNSAIPYHPERAFKGKGWINWPTFLGVKSKISRGETAVNSFLTYNDIKFISQWKTSICKNKRALAFDFGIFKEKSLIALIEYHGGQHFKPVEDWGGQNNYNKVIIHDLIKSDWAKLQNIPLIILKGDTIAIFNDLIFNLEIIFDKKMSAPKRYEPVLDTKFLDFKQARDFVRQLNFKNQENYYTWVKSGHKPQYIPSGPWSTYRKRGWISWGDWLGTGYIARKNRKYAPYSEAKQWALDMNIKSGGQWRKFNKVRPNNIPSSPETFYKNKGWTNWYDFLGKSV